jgi:hypothetical protein
LSIQYLCGRHGFLGSDIGALPDSSWLDYKDRMKCWIKVATVVLLLALLGADVGLQTARTLGSPPVPVVQTTVEEAGGTKWTDRAQADSAIMVAVFTAVLLVASVGQWFTMRAQARHASGQLAAFQQGQRPYLFVLSISSITYELDPGDYPMQCITYTVVNHGQTPAIIDRFRIGASVDRLRPRPPESADDNHPLLLSPVMASGEKREHLVCYLVGEIRWKEYYDPDMHGPGDEPQYPDGFTPVLEDGELLFLCAEIDYHGASTAGHSTSACWRYNPASYQFVQHGGDEYNYIR